ncbi:hypothetical protein [Pareuzebyella sediminis]|uniref:hypothetical protein n=1 Tax=Pareuzebyella sediminis TaxID=2607998 RepID=UPI0011EBE6F4|nr:hypothetical protein [Pareuzebyella sediminis]
MKNAPIEAVYNELNSVYENLKAEILVAEIEENTEVSIEDFVVHNKGTFSRAYRRDVIRFDDVQHENKITLNLSRNGLYDILPEGLFHRPYVGQGREAYGSRRKMLKKEEQDARLFFAPLENEFFYQRVEIEQKERALIHQFYSPGNDFLINFWRLDKAMPNRYLLKLLKLLPHSDKITGDLEMARGCLEKTLEEKVVFRKKYVERHGHKPEEFQTRLTTGFRLGVDSVLSGVQTKILEPLLEITIGPIPENKIANYFKKNGVMKFIKTFCDFFLPLEFEIDTKIIVQKEFGFVLSNTSETRIGLSTYL